MNDLIARHLMAETTLDDKRRLREWRRASTENDALYHRQVRVWELLGILSAPTSARHAPPAAELVERAGIHRLPGARVGEVRASRRSSGHRTLRLRIAAGLVLAAAGITALVLVTRPHDDATRLGAAEFVTGQSEVTTVRLDDGTVVRLAPRSRLEFEGGSVRTRQVSFEGLGYFAVAKDPTRPFIVRTPAGDAHVIGTRFELRAVNDDIRVIVVEGQVALDVGGERKEIGASQMGRAGPHQPLTVLNVAELDELLDWVDGLFVFQATPLRKVARELEQHYAVEIRIEDAELASRDVTAWLRDQSFDAALTAVCGAVGADCTIRRDGATMRLHGRDQ